jgi:hypothetical protein
MTLSSGTEAEPLGPERSEIHPFDRRDTFERNRSFISMDNLAHPDNGVVGFPRTGNPAFRIAVVLSSVSLQ